MANGVALNSSIIAVKQEVTEGTYVAPAAATDYIQPLSDGFELTPSKELVERSILTSSIGAVVPRVGTESVTAALPVELRGSGVEGAKTDFDLLVLGALGNSRQITSRVTTKTGNSASVLQIQDADIASLSVGDIVVILEAGAHHVCAISAKTTGIGTATVTIVPSAGASFSDNVEISKSTTYYPANSGHPSLSLSYYLGNEILSKAIGTKVAGMEIQNFSTGQVASFAFSMEGLSFGELDGSAPHTPTYDSGIPPLILNACLFQNGIELPVNEFTLSLENTLGKLSSTCDGYYSQRVTQRAISGTMNPYMDDTTTVQFDKFDQNLQYSIFVSAYNPSTVAGEIDLGSVVGIYLPACITTEFKHDNQDGILSDSVSFRATRGTSGTTEEMYLGFV
jgi:hypothetical protein